MCTVSWWRREDRLTLRFNRDERRGRPPAEPPADHRGCVWPRDPQGGGTWVCVDPAGTVHCVLNDYGAQNPRLPANPRSRGELPLSSATNEGNDLSVWLRPEDYPPFHLLRIPLRGKFRHVIWNGRALRPGPDHPELTHWTTSGWNTEEVVRARAELFQSMIREQGLSEETLTAFHFAKDAADPGRWPRMSREDALTVSYAEITVTENERSFCYIPLGDHGKGKAVTTYHRRAAAE